MKHLCTCNITRNKNNPLLCKEMQGTFLPRNPSSSLKTQTNLSNNTPRDPGRVGVSATPLAVSNAVASSKRGSALLSKHPDFAVKRTEEGSGSASDTSGEEELSLGRPYSRKKNSKSIIHKKKSNHQTTTPTPWEDKLLLQCLDLKQVERMEQAKHIDMQYARLVAGGMHVRSLDSVWGPRCVYVCVCANE